MHRTIAVLIACAGFAGIAAAQSTTKPDTRSDTLRTESVPADKAQARKSGVALNLNSASVGQLAALPGVGDARARAIIKGRPYRSKDELLKKKILPENVYEDVKGNLYAGK